jgi:tetratricopeptide (TPR) repeat protein
MKKIILWSQSVVLVIFIATVSSFAQSGTSNSISGFVFDAVNRKPVPDVYVELLSDVYSSLRRAKTDGSGRYFFGGISKGSFKVKVLPYGTNYLEEVQDVEITNYTIGRTTTSDSVYLDIYLRLDKRKINISELNPAGSVFIQDIPLSARDLYKKGIAQLEKVKEAELGMGNLKKALEIFPNYYDALNRVGIEHIRHNEYFEALPYLIKAIEVNQRSFTSFYALGLAAYNLKQMKEAVDAFRAATVINPQSVYANFQYGKVLRINGNYKEAEQSLLKAESLSKHSPIGEIHWQLGLLYDKVKRYNEAADELEKYLKIEPEISNSKQIKTLIGQMREKAKK